VEHAIYSADRAQSLSEKHGGWAERFHITKVGAPPFSTASPRYRVYTGRDTLVCNATSEQISNHGWLWRRILLATHSAPPFCGRDQHRC